MRRLAPIAALLAAFVAMLFACSGEPSETGLAEPIRLRNASFKTGDLPGDPPVAATAAGAAPLITSFETASTVVRPGQTEKGLLGRASPDAVAVGLRFADVGSGYWVLPVDAPDPQNNGELGWQAVADFGANVAPGIHALRVVAIDGAGHAGTQRELSVCITPNIPDNLNACDPKSIPPAAVLSLAWDTPVDLDLVVVTPDGRIVDAKHPRTIAPPSPGPSTGAADAGATANAGTFDRDSNGGCVIDGAQRENLVFQARPAPGSYLVYASLFDACGRAPVHFRFSLYEPQATADPKIQQLVESITKKGVLLGIEASGGSRLGTFVTEVTF
ncbi:MAG: hypothetical protein JWP87_5022 [Labilithrix sp.]|nr:hypothetical protein [Labilithrix sp.]